MCLESIAIRRSRVVIIASVHGVSRRREVPKGEIAECCFGVFAGRACCAAKKRPHILRKRQIRQCNTCSPYKGQRQNHLSPTNTQSIPGCRTQSNLQSICSLE